MAVDIKKVNEKASAYATHVRQILPVYKVFIYGSYAKGNATEYSDVDICFFLNNFGGKRRVDIIKELLSLTVGYDDIGFEPIVLPSSELINGNPFATEVVNTGIEI